MADEKPEDVNVNGIDNLSVVLRKAVTANGEEVKELKFREPTAADIERAGIPIIIDPGVVDDQGLPRFRFDTKVMTQMMSLLAAVPPSTIRQMHPNDWNNAAWVLVRFFMPGL